jgi:hypothetical protein
MLPHRLEPPVLCYAAGHSRDGFPRGFPSFHVSGPDLDLVGRARKRAPGIFPRRTVLDRDVFFCGLNTVLKVDRTGFSSGHSHQKWSRTLFVRRFLVSVAGVGSPILWVNYLLEIRDPTQPPVNLPSGDSTDLGVAYF